MTQGFRLCYALSVMAVLHLHLYGTVMYVLPLGMLMVFAWLGALRGVDSRALLLLALGTSLLGELLLCRQFLGLHLVAGLACKLFSRVFFFSAYARRPVVTHIRGVGAMLEVSLAAYALAELWPFVPELLGPPVVLYAVAATLINCLVIMQHKTRCVISGVMALTVCDLLKAVDLWVIESPWLQALGHVTYFWAHMILVLGETPLLGCVPVPEPKEDRAQLEDGRLSRLSQPSGHMPRQRVKQSKR